MHVLIESGRRARRVTTLFRQAIVPIIMAIEDNSKPRVNSGCATMHEQACRTAPLANKGSQKRNMIRAAVQTAMATAARAAVPRRGRKCATGAADNLLLPLEKKTTTADRAT